jgi:hypothetical protein
MVQEIMPCVVNIWDKANQLTFLFVSWLKVLIQFNSILSLRVWTHMQEEHIILVFCLLGLMQESQWWVLTIPLYLKWKKMRILYKRNYERILIIFRSCYNTSVFVWLFGFFVCALCSWCRLRSTRWSYGDCSKRCCCKGTFLFAVLTKQNQ